MARKAPHKYIVPYGFEADIDDPYICVSFFCPSEWWAVAALLGSFASLGKRELWRDDEQGRIAADRFLKAWIMSRDDEFMSNVNVQVDNYIETGSSSACCDTTTNVEVIINSGNPVEVEVDGSEPLPVAAVEEIPTFATEEGITTLSEYDELRCKIANFMADKVMASIDKFNTVIGIVKGEVAEGLAARVGAAVALMYADGPYFIGDVAGAILILSPKVFNWIVSTAYPGDIENLGIDINREQIVDTFYNAETASDWGNVFYGILEPAIEAAPVSESLKDIYKSYFRFWYGTRLANWYGKNAKNLIVNQIPADYVPPTPCATLGVDVYQNWEFNTDGTQGWSFELTNAGNFLSAPTGAPNNAPSASTGLIGWTPVDTAILGTVKLYRDINLPVVSDHGIGWVPYRNGGRCFCRAEFSDGSFLESAWQDNGINLSPLQHLDISSKVGLNLTRIEITNESDLGLAGRRMQWYDVIIGNEFGTVQPGSVEQTT